MSKNPMESIDTPIGDLEWVIISGDGKEDLNGNPKYQVSVVLDPDNNASHAAFIAKVHKFWDDNKPAGFKNTAAAKIDKALINTPSSIGLYPHTEPTGEKDEEGKNIYKETGKTVLAMKTGTTYQDGSPKVIKVFNAKGAEVALGNKKIANGSRGRAGGMMAIYATTDKTGKTVVNAGVTFYLNKLQLTKFVEYSGDTFDAVEDEEGETFEGFPDDGMGAISDEGSTEAQAVPRLD